MSAPKVTGWLYRWFHRSFLHEGEIVSGLFKGKISLWDADELSPEEVVAAYESSVRENYGDAAQERLRTHPCGVVRITRNELEDLGIALKREGPKGHFNSAKISNASAAKLRDKARKVIDPYGTSLPE